MRRTLFSACVLLLGVAGAPDRVRAEPLYEVRHAFERPPTHPEGALIQGTDGALYGTTDTGGVHDKGTVYKVNADGSGLTVLYAFDGATGALPFAGPLSLGGMIYGVAYKGGTADKGVLFRINENGTGYTVLHEFDGTLGGYPYGPLVASNGVIFGTTEQGGANGKGTVFKIGADGAGFAVVHDFGLADEHPRAALTSAGGVLYGATDRTVFKLNEDGSGFVTLYDFAASVWGSRLLLSGSTLLGTTAYGGAYGHGSIFKINIDGTLFQVLRSFNAPAGGRNPFSGLTASGSTLFGVTAYGGFGTVFKINQTGTGFAVLHTFTGADGANPVSDLLLLNGMLYGTTYQGGTGGMGTLFQIRTDGTVFKRLRNMVAKEGRRPRGGVLRIGNDLYGTTASGGGYDKGIVYKLAADDTFTRLVEFTGANGADPTGALIAVGNVLYGTTSRGGAQNGGTVFQVKTDGTGFRKLRDLICTEGCVPLGGLVTGGGVLYGTTSSSGPRNKGTIFRMNLDGSAFATLHAFGGGPKDGAYPETSLLLSAGALYGTTLAGGAPGIYLDEGGGVVFKMNVNGTGFAVLRSFPFSEVGAFLGPLALSGPYLYGTTKTVGRSTPDDGEAPPLAGSIFRLKKNGTGYARLRVLSASEGELPSGVVVRHNHVYGTAQSGGANGAGTLFSMRADGTDFSVLADMESATGSYPTMPLAIDLEGAFHGSAERDGPGGLGVVFRVQADRDDDGVLDPADNCPVSANANQADADADGIGDLCDNCPALANIGQEDADEDGVGDACGPPLVFVKDVSVTEGNTGTKLASFVVTLSKAPTIPLSVVIQTSDGTATAGSDYVAVGPATLTFSPVQTSRTVNVKVIGDLLDEDAETFTLNLSSPVNATIIDGEGTATIVDDDALPTLSVTNATVTEGHSGTTPMTFTATLAKPSGRSVGVSVTRAGGTAQPTVDFTGTLPQEWSFAPGETQKTIVLDVVGDTTPEAAETVLLRIGTDFATLARTQVKGTITNDDCDDCVSACRAEDALYQLPVLVLSFFPLDSSGSRLDADVTGISASLESMRAKVAGLTAAGLATLTEASTYHGYKSVDAKCSIHYSIRDDFEFLEAVPLSTNEIPWNPGIYRPDYRSILADLDICRYVERLGVREVWMWSYHHGNIEPVESNMAGPYGDISNSERIDDMPTCDRSYVLYNYNYARGLGELLENHGHHIEAVLGHADADMFWGRFVVPYNTAGVNHCGWTHFPPNGTADYDWHNPNTVLSNCEDWHPDGSGTVSQLSCANWGCSDDGGVGFKTWWMQSIPGRDSGLTYGGKPLRNWWDFKADFDTAMAAGRTLVTPP